MVVLIVFSTTPLLITHFSKYTMENNLNHVKALSLISSGIDSPVATYLMIQKGIEVLGIHFDNQPFTDERPREKTIKLLTHISNLTGKSIKLYIINHGKIQSEFMKNTERRYGCIFCRRMMFRVSEKIAELEGCKYLITGENMGQVASQTLDNMAVTDNAVKIPILRPILTNDKQETIDFAKKIGTYEISIEKGICCHAVPKNPATLGKIEFAEKEEKKVDVESLIRNAVESAEIVIINPEK